MNKLFLTIMCLVVTACATFPTHNVNKDLSFTCEWIEPEFVERCENKEAVCYIFNYTATCTNKVQRIDFQ